MSPAVVPTLHPLTPLTPEEIRSCASVLRSAYPPNVDFNFKAITLDEPPKAALISWLEGSGEELPRRGYVCYYIRNTDKLFEAIVLLGDGEGKPGVLETNVQVNDGYHSAADNQEVVDIEKVALEDEGVKVEIAKLELPKGAVVVADPWIYGLGSPPVVIDRTR